ncbi:MAG: hypothetical protein ACC656_10525, partial [Candidatus Heimdallarchaeota archaeon]
MGKKKNVNKSKKKISSEIVEDSDGRQYHIGLASGEVANTILIVGDPARAKKVSKYFDEGSIRIEIQNREY